MDLGDVLDPLGYIVIPDIAESLNFLAYVHLYLLPYLISNRHRIVDCGFEAEVADKLTSKCLWLVIRVTNIPHKTVRK